MGDFGNFGTLEDWKNVRDAWLGSAGKSHRKIRFYTFQEYETMGNQSNPNETFRKQKYTVREDHAWLSFVKVFDTVKGGYQTTGDIDVVSEFPIRGYSAFYTLPSGVAIPEYAGDLVEWNGKLWEVADVLELIQFGMNAPQAWYHTVMRRTNLSGQGITVGP